MIRANYYFAIKILPYGTYILRTVSYTSTLSASCDEARLAC
jgi:hypothetical protein